MRKGGIVLVILIVLAVVLIGAVPGDARVVFRGGVWIDPWWGWGPWYYPYAPYFPSYAYPYDPYYYAASPVVIERQPQTYVEPAPQHEEKQYYWYFCSDPQGYYPYVQKCPKGWKKVVPPSVPPDYAR